MFKRVPGLAIIVNTGLRVARGVFWSYRPAPDTADTRVPWEYISFLESEIAGDVFTFVEVGAGDGRVLRHLATRYPRARFIGLDIQKAAVAQGMEFLKGRGLTNVELIRASGIDEGVVLDCDYLASRAALIYLNRREISTFFRIWLPRIRRELLLQEIVSLTNRTESSYFFAHPLPLLAEEAGGDAYAAHVQLLDYAPWKQEGRWSGADIVIHRKGSV
jgi:hypothetical protein